MQKNLYIPIDIQIKNIVECTQLVKRGDTLTLIIKVFNNAVLSDLTSQSVDLIIKKSDGKLIEKTITSVSNGVITATLDVQATNVAGIVQGEVQIYTSDTLSSTNTFTFNVDSSLADDVLEASQDDIEVLADLKNTITAGNAAIDKYKENVEAIASSADAVEALADIKLYIDTNLADLQQANAQATVNITNETEQNTQATHNIADLTTINNTSSTLKSELDSDISNGNTLKSGLESDITTGDTLKNNLETDFATGNQLKSDLESIISTGGTLKTNLDTANTQAEANIEALNALGDVTEIAQDVTNLKNEVETARGTYNKLGARLDADESNITSNSNKIGDLSANGLTEANLAAAIKNDRAQLSEKANDTDSSRTTTAKTVTGSINELNDVKLFRVAQSIAVTVDLFTLKPGHYCSEGAIATTQNYPIASAFMHCTIVVTGLSNADGTGYRTIRLTTHTGVTYENTQAWTLGTWSGWKQVFNNAEIITIIPNASLLNGWSNNTDADWARVTAYKVNNMVQIRVIGCTGSNTSSPAFTLPSSYASMWVYDSAGSGINIVDRSVYFTKANIADVILNYMEV